VYEESDANPVPLTVTVSPTTPFVSESEMLGPTVREVDAVWAAPSVATTL
jgi:hypothetical protein